jgi:preprotein translocase subunit SecY
MGMPLYYFLYMGGIIFFAYFYTAIIFNPDDVAENMRKYGGFVPGIRPGKRTAEYIDTILTRITLVGAIYLALIAVLPDLMIVGFRVAAIPFIGDSLDAVTPRWITDGLGVTFYFGGTSLLIIVGVSMDTVQQVESQLIMRHYDGFMRKTRIRGRRG